MQNNNNSDKELAFYKVSAIVFAAISVTLYWFRASIDNSELGSIGEAFYKGALSYLLQYAIPISVIASVVFLFLYVIRRIIKVNKGGRNGR